MKANWMLGCGAVLVAAVLGCGNSSGTGGSGGTGTTSTTSSTSKSSSSSSKSVTATGTGTGTGSGTGGGAAQTPCNPVKDTQCNVAGGEACDFGQNAEFECWPAPPPNTVDLCGACSVQTSLCKDGSTCLAADAGGTMAKCVKYCCTDADCGGAAGSCAKDPNFSSTVGICGTFNGGGGAGGGGGFVTPICTGIPASPPSNGACYTP